MNISQAILHDYDLARRDARTAEAAWVAGAKDVSVATEVVLRGCDKSRLVYTAFDGDHFQLCSHMRRFVMARGFVPANPESILGYKDVVTAYGNKREVIRDDLSILAKCDELWVFTEQLPTPDGVADLAEGVAIELLFFLSRAKPASVLFVPPLSLVRGGSGREAKSFSWSYEQVLAAIPYEQAKTLSTCVEALGDSLRPLLYYIHDPLDFKYSAWLREDAYRRKAAPLVPGLALELAEAQAVAGGEDVDEPLLRALVAWAKLTGLAELACTLPPMEPVCTPSFVASVLTSVFERRKPDCAIEQLEWQRFSIPKAHGRSTWSLTDKEREPRSSLSCQSKK